MKPKDGQEDDFVLISAGDGLIMPNQEPLTLQLLLETIHRLQSERDEARSELAFVQAEYAAANESDLTRDALCLQLAALKHELRMAEERAAIAARERDEAVALNQAMSRVLAEYRDGYVYCEQHGHEQQEPCPQCAEEKR